MPETKRLTLDTLKAGVAHELFDRELARVIENIKDPNTTAKKKRQIRLLFTFEPHEDRNGARDEMAVTIESEAKLAPVMGAGTFAFIGREGSEIHAYTHDVEQAEMPLETVDKSTGEVLPMKTRRPGA